MPIPKTMRAAVVEKFREPLVGSRWVAAISRTLTWIILVLPNRSNSCSCTVRNNFGCICEDGT
jgi:hypothetical protein